MHGESGFPRRQGRHKKKTLFFEKGLDCKYLSFTSHIVSVTTSQICLCCGKAAIDKT